MAKMKMRESPSRKMEEQPKDVARWIANRAVEASSKETSE